MQGGGLGVQFLQLTGRRSLVRGCGGSHRRQAHTGHPDTSGAMASRPSHCGGRRHQLSGLVCRQWGARMGVYVRSRGLIFTWRHGAVQPAAMCPMFVLKKGLGKAATSGARGQKKALGR